MLVDAIAPVAGGSKIALIGSLSRALRMSARFYGTGDENVLILPSAAVINDFLAVACAALVSVFGTDPDIEVSRGASLNMDSAPAADPTTPPGPYRSMWQTDAIAIKIRWPMAEIGLGGAIRIGCPLSNSAASSIAMRGPLGSEPGRPTTVRSNVRP